METREPEMETLEEERGGHQFSKGFYYIWHLHARWIRPRISSSRQPGETNFLSPSSSSTNLKFEIDRNFVFFARFFFLFFFFLFLKRKKKFARLRVMRAKVSLKKKKQARLLANVSWYRLRKAIYEARREGGGGGGRGRKKGS